MGSVRIPASYCGIYGFKPSRAVLEMDGCLPLSPSLDHLGLFATTAGGLKLFFEQLTKSVCRPPEGMAKIGVPEDFVRHLVTDSTMNKFNTFCSVLSRSGCATLEKVDISLLAASAKAGRTIVFKEAWDSYGFMLEKQSSLGRDVATCLALGRDIGAKEYEEALDFKRKFTIEIEAYFRHYDFLLLPAVPDSAPLADTKTIMLQGKEVRLAEPLTALNYPASMAGLPALTIPFFTDGELPIGFQLIAGRGEDLKLLSFAALFETSLKFYSSPTMVKNSFTPCRNRATGG